MKQTNFNEPKWFGQKLEKQGMEKLVAITVQGAYRSNEAKPVNEADALVEEAPFDEGEGMDSEEFEQELSLEQLKAQLAALRQVAA